MSDSRKPLESEAKLRGGDFYIESPPLGMGGFGITYRAVDKRLNRVVAVKEFFPQGCLRVDGKLEASSGWTIDGLKAQRDRFLEEGRTLARLRHPGIPIIYDIFEENETAYLVMEFVEGQTFAQYLADKKLWFLPPDEALGLIQGAGDALAVMHSAQLLHRDLKPANIMRRHDGQVMLIDFGASRDFLPEAMHTLTVIFTAGYAPLEQYTRSGTHGPFTDVYSLAATLYHLLTGQKPLEAPRRATGEVLPSPHQLNPVISPALSDAVMHGLEITPNRRPATVEEFLRELGAGQASKASHVNQAADDGTVAVTTDTVATIPVPITPTPQPASPPTNTPAYAMPSTYKPSQLSNYQPKQGSRIQRWQESLSATFISSLKVGMWSGLGWCIGLLLGAFLLNYIQFSVYTNRRMEVAWYFQLDTALFLAMCLGRWSYLKQKKLRNERLGRSLIIDPSKFNQVLLAQVWGAAASSVWIGVLGAQYMAVTNGRYGYPNIQEPLLALLVIWPILWVWYFTNRFYKRHRAVRH